MAVPTFVDTGVTFSSTAFTPFARKKAGHWVAISATSLTVMVKVVVAGVPLPVALELETQNLKNIPGLRRIPGLI